MYETADNGATYTLVNTDSNDYCILEYQHISGKALDGTYFTYDGETYTEVAKDGDDMTLLLTGTVYYTCTPEEYSAVDTANAYDATAAYYTRTGTEGNYTYTQVASDIQYYTKAFDYQAVTTTDSFDNTTDYYIYNGSQYVKAEGITAFVVGEKYFTYSPASFEVANSYTYGKQYYVEGADVINAVVVYNGDETVKPINAGDYTASVTAIAGAEADDKTGNYEYVVDTTKDVDFTITKRTVTITVKDFEIGYGDTKIVPANNETGYTLETGSLDFVAEDITSKNLVLTYTAEDLTGDPGKVTPNAVSLALSGDAAVNYTLEYATATASDSYGKLTIKSKELANLELKETTITYTGSDLKDELELDTNAADSLNITKYQKKVDDSTWEDVEDIVGVGDYRIIVEKAEGAQYFNGNTAEIEFTVEKALYLVENIERANIAIFYDHFVISGNFEGKVMVSADGVEFKEATLSGLKPLTRYTFFVKIAESDNFNESVVVTFSATTSYNPALVNSALTDLGNKFGYGDISTYTQIIQNYGRVSEGDRVSIDSAKLNAAKARYELLLSSGAKAIKVTKQVIAKASNKTYKVAAVGAVSSFGLIFAGLSMLMVKRKKKEEMKKAHRVFNKKNLLVVLVIAISIISLTMSFIACDKKIDEPDTPTDDDTLTDTTFFTAASNVDTTKASITASIVEKESDIEIYNRKANGSENAKFDIEIDDGTFEDIANQLTFRTDAFSSTKIEGTTFTGTVSNPAEYVGISEEGVSITSATLTITLDTSNKVKDMQLVFDMTINEIEYESTVKVTPKTK